MHEFAGVAFLGNQTRIPLEVLFVLPLIVNQKYLQNCLFHEEDLFFRIHFSFITLKYRFDLERVRNVCSFS